METKLKAVITAALSIIVIVGMSGCFGNSDKNASDQGLISWNIPLIGKAGDDKGSGSFGSTSELNTNMVDDPDGIVLCGKISSPDWSKVSVANIVIGSDAYRFNNTYTFDIKAALKDPADNEWIEVDMPLSGSEKYGDPNKCRINAIMVRIKDDGNGAGEFLITDLSYRNKYMKRPRYIANLFLWDNYYIGKEGSVREGSGFPGRALRIETLKRHEYNGISRCFTSRPLNLSSP